MQRSNDRNSPELIARIAAKMEEKRYNIPAFAAALRMSRQWGYAVMKNQIRLSGDMIKKIADILGVTTDSLHYSIDEQEGKIDIKKFIIKICDERIDERLKEFNKTNQGASHE